MLDYNVFENVCKFLRELIDSGKKPVPISVNVSRYTVDYEDYIKTINRIRNKYNIPLEKKAMLFQLMILDLVILI